MIKNICKDLAILSKKSVDCTIADLSVVTDLVDTLKFNQQICVGMAANMIGVNKNIIAFYDNNKVKVLLNPKIIRHSKKYYELEEGCLSLEGLRLTKRYDSVTVEYYDLSFKKRISTFFYFSAEIVQHEIDHLDGVII